MAFLRLPEWQLPTTLEDFQAMDRQDVLVAAAATLTATYAIKSIYSSWSLSNKLPPGPRGLPVVGYLPFLGKKAYESFLELGKKYGPIFSLNVGGRYAIVINDWPSIKEALSTEEILARPKLLGKIAAPSILDTNGAVWRDQRRFALHQLRDLGAH